MRLKITLFAVLTLMAAPAFASEGGEAHGAKGKTPAKREITTLKSWVDVDAFTVSVIQRAAIKGTFVLSFGLDVPDDALRAQAEAILPRLRNNWLLAINQYAATFLRPHTQADLTAITTRLQRVTDETLGKPGAKILLGNAIVNVD